MYKWKVEVEENTQLSFCRKVKRSSYKFALEKLITVFFVAGSSEEKPTQEARVALCYRLVQLLCSFRALQPPTCSHNSMVAHCMYTIS